MDNDDYVQYVSEWHRRYGYKISTCVEYKPNCWLTFGLLRPEDFQREVKSIPHASERELERLSVVLLMDKES